MCPHGCQSDSFPLSHKPRRELLLSSLTSEFASCFFIQMVGPQMEDHRLGIFTAATRVLISLWLEINFRLGDLLEI